MCSGVAIITCTSVRIHIINTGTINTWAGDTFIDVCNTHIIKLWTIYMNTDRVISVYR